MVSMRDIEYEADGRRMIGRLGLPDGDGARPAVLICHEGPGLDDFQKDKAGTFSADPDRVRALELARGGADLKAVVGFHAGLGTTRPEDARNLTGKVLVCIGSEDPFIPLEQRLAFEEEMRAGGVDWRMNLYGGVEHSFTHPWAELAEIPGVKYDQPTAQRSRRAMLDLFDEAFA